MREKKRDRVPAPRPDRARPNERVGLTFFVTPPERARVLRKLRGYGSVRSLALLAALGVDPCERRENKEG